MTEIHKIIIAWVSLIISMLCLRIFFPTFGLYLFCFSLVALLRLYNRQSKLKKNVTSLLLFSIAWFSLVAKAFEWQGDKIAGMLCEYSNKKSMPDNTYLTSSFNIMAYSPIFTKYTYQTKNDSPKGFEDIQLSFNDIWGNHKVYCDADGEFEIK